MPSCSIGRYSTSTTSRSRGQWASSIVIMSSPPKSVAARGRVSLRRRALEQLVGAPRIGQRQRLGHHRVDLVPAEQLEQHGEVLPEPLRVPGASTHQARGAPSGHGQPLATVAQPLDAVGEHSPAGREQAAQCHGRGRGIPLEPRPAVLVPVGESGVVAVQDEPSAGAQRAEGAQRRDTAEPVEHDVHAVAGELAHPGQEVLAR